MNPPKTGGLDYIHFLVAAQKEFTCTEAVRSHPEEEDGPAHDAFTRLLQRQPPSAVALWQEAEPAVDPGDGLLILDDTTLEGPYANEIEHISWHWSGKHGDAVKGINSPGLLWRGSPEENSVGDPSSEEESEETPRETHVPCGFRPCKKEGETKNEHLREMLDRASGRGYGPEYVVFDS